MGRFHFCSGEYLFSILSPQVIYQKCYREFSDRLTKGREKRHAFCFSMMANNIQMKVLLSTYYLIVIPTTIIVSSPFHRIYNRMVVVVVVDDITGNVLRSFGVLEN